jgi:hypothetical protein
MSPTLKQRAALGQLRLVNVRQDPTARHRPIPRHAYYAARLAMVAACGVAASWVFFTLVLSLG